VDLKEQWKVSAIVTKSNSTRANLIAPSILSADFSRLKEEIGDVERAGCDVIHVDVMDGHFVPNITIGPVVVGWARKVTKLPLDVHLMISEPSRYVEAFRKAGADWITIHVEINEDVGAVLKKIKLLGAKVGLSLRPKTPIEKVLPYLQELDLVLVMSVEPGFGGQSFMPDMMEKIRILRKQFNGHISVDGGISPQNIQLPKQAGANVFVAGSSVFGAANRKQRIQELRTSIG